MSEQFFDCLKREQDICIKPKLRGLQVKPRLKRDIYVRSKRLDRHKYRHTLFKHG